MYALITRLGNQGLTSWVDNQHHHGHDNVGMLILLWSTGHWWVFLLQFKINFDVVTSFIWSILLLRKQTLLLFRGHGHRAQDPTMSPLMPQLKRRDTWQNNTLQNKGSPSVLQEAEVRNIQKYTYRLVCGVLVHACFLWNGFLLERLFSKTPTKAKPRMNLENLNTDNCCRRESGSTPALSALWSFMCIVLFCDLTSDRCTFSNSDTSTVCLFTYVHWCANVPAYFCLLLLPGPSQPPPLPATVFTTWIKMYKVTIIPVFISTKHKSHLLKTLHWFWHKHFIPLWICLNKKSSLWYKCLFDPVLKSVFGSF